MSCHWHKHYDEGVPESCHPYPEQTLLDTLAENTRLRPQSTALRFLGRRFSWKELEILTDSCAAALYALGLRSGDRLALLLPNCPQFVISQLGAWKLGAIVSPLNPLYSAEELTHAFNETGAAAAVVLTTSYDKVKSLQATTHLRFIVAAGVKNFLPPWKKLMFTLFREGKEGHRIDLRAGDYRFFRLMSQYRGRTAPLPQPRPEDPALLMFTGGTTGRPKAALSSHHALFISASQILAWFNPIREEWRDRILLLMPLFHTYGNIGVLNVGLLGRMIMVVVPDPRDINGLIQTIEKERPNYLSGVPTLFNALQNHPHVQEGQADFTSIKVSLCGTYPLLEETKKRFEALTDGHLIEGYALTESVMGLSVTPVLGGAPAGSVGVPLPDVEVRIANPEDHRETQPAGEVGEILLRCPQLMLGYWQRPEETAGIIQNGWLCTGDLGYFDEDGFLFIAGRIKDLIKPSGFQVWPREVEEVIAGHAEVIDVGVAGVPDPLRGETVKAWVVRTEGSELTAAELRAYCREHLIAYKVPRQVEFRSSLPKSVIGKVLRRELLEEEAAEINQKI